MLEPLGLELHLVHPQKTWAIASARIKHDQLDSRILARLLHAGFIAEAWIAPQPVRELRQLVRHRTRSVRWATRAKNGVYGVLNRQGISAPLESMFGPKGRAFLREVELWELDRWAGPDQLLRLDLLVRQIRELDQETPARSRGSAAAQALQEIPGIGPFLALLLVAEIGYLRRFPTAKQLVSYLGLAPSLYASGERRWTGEITKQGSSLLRWALVQAAHVAARSPRFQEFYARQRERHGTAKAAVALARKQASRRKLPAEEKIRILLEGIQGEVSVSELCRREGIHPTIYYKWLKDFMEAGKARMRGDSKREATRDEVQQLRQENGRLKQRVADLSLSNLVLKKRLY